MLGNGNHLALEPTGSNALCSLNILPVIGHGQYDHLLDRDRLFNHIPKVRVGGISNLYVETFRSQCGGSFLAQLNAENQPRPDLFKFGVCA